MRFIVIRLYNGDNSLLGYSYKCIIIFFIFQQYTYRDLTAQEIINVIFHYKDLRPVLDAYRKILCFLGLWKHNSLSFP